VISVTSRTPCHYRCPYYTPQTLGNFMQSTLSPLRKSRTLSITKHVAFKDILFYVLDGQSPRCASYQRWVFDDLESTLARIDQYKRGREILRNWSLSPMCKVVDREMRKVKKAFAMKTREITPEFVETWSFSGFREAIKANTPTIQAFKRHAQGMKERRIRCSYMFSPATISLWLTQCRSFQSSFPPSPLPHPIRRLPSGSGFKAKPSSLGLPSTSTAMPQNHPHPTETAERCDPSRLTSSSHPSPLAAQLPPRPSPAPSTTETDDRTTKGSQR